MEKTAVYAGSFDPFTNGHLDIVRDAAKVFDRVYVCISENSNKKRFTDVNLIASAITATLEYEGLTNCVVVYHKGLVADFCKSHNINYLIRGLRNTTDYMYEENIAKFNYELNPDLKTIYFRGTNDVISSSMIRELIKYNYWGKVQSYVPRAIYDLLRAGN